jgi:hypothetical protein
MYFDTGETYEGAWWENFMHGQGVLSIEGGVTFAVRFINGVPEDTGVLENTVEAWSYSGSVLDFMPHGSGIKRFADSGVYNGEFREGLRHGRGTMTYANGD